MSYPVVSSAQWENDRFSQQLQQKFLSVDLAALNQTNEEKSNTFQQLVADLLEDVKFHRALFIEIPGSFDDNFFALNGLLNFGIAFCLFLENLK